MERLIRNIEKNATTGCWNWTGSAVRGYGVCYLDDGTFTGAHRAAYIMLRGPLAREIQIHHTCENKLCCNPDHLLPVTGAEHRAVDRNSMQNKTHCKRGHPLSGDNLSPARLKAGKRICKQCASLRVQKFMNKDPAAYRLWHNAYQKRKRNEAKEKD